MITLGLACNADNHSMRTARGDALKENLTQTDHT